jgi:hypothetical protein
MKRKPLWIPIFVLAAVLGSLALAVAPAAFASSPESAAASPPDSLGVIPAILEIDPQRNRLSPDFELVPIRLTDGQPHPDLEPIPIGFQYTTALSEDGEWLAVAVKGAYNRMGQLLIVDVAQWTARTFEIELPFPAARILLDTEHERLVLIAQMGTVVTENTGYRIVWYDYANGRVLSSAENLIDFFPNHAALLADGTQLALAGGHLGNAYEVEPATHAALIDLRQMAVAWTPELPDILYGMSGVDEDYSNWEEAMYYSPGLAFDPANSLLYIAHAGSDTLTTVDFNQRSVATTDLQPVAHNWLEALLLWDARRAQAKTVNSSTRQALVIGEYLVISGETTRMVPDPKQKDNWLIEQTAEDLLIVRRADLQVERRVPVAGSHLQPGLSDDHVLVQLSEPANGETWLLVDLDSGKAGPLSIRGELTVLPVAHDGYVALSSQWVEKNSGYSLALLNELYRPQTPPLAFKGFASWLWVWR